MTILNHLCQTNLEYLYSIVTGYTYRPTGCSRDSVVVLVIFHGDSISE